MDELQAAWVELKARLEALAGERGHHLEVFERAPLAYVITDADGTIYDANGEAVDLFQRRRSDLRGRPLAALIALDQRNAFRTWLRSLGARGAAGECLSIVEAPGLRVAVRLDARLMPGGICWRVQALQ